MIFKLSEEYNYSRVFSSKEDAEDFAHENVDGFYSISDDDEDPEAFKLEWDTSKDLSKISDEDEFDYIWGNKKSRNQKFIDKYRNLLHGLKVYYLTFRNGKPVITNNNIIYYRNRQDAEDRLKYYALDLDIASIVL